MGITIGPNTQVAQILIQQYMKDTKLIKEKNLTTIKKLYGTYKIVPFPMVDSCKDKHKKNGSV
jgi:hypothetical protein